MSALQLRVLLEHVCNRELSDVYFRFKPTDMELRLHIWYLDAGGNSFHRSFGTDGGFLELND